MAGRIVGISLFLGGLLIGCAGSRKISVGNRNLDLAAGSVFYIRLNHEHERVVYDFSASPLDYGEYGGGRKRETVKPDVPVEIAKALVLKKKEVLLGGGGSYPGGDTVVIAYEELWGWDMGDILKRLKITAFMKDAPEKASTVAFEEMTFFNTHPTAESVVPVMMDSLLFLKAAP